MGEFYVDAFGARGDPWPSGLPSVGYWTGTGHTDVPGDSWIVLDRGGKVFVYRVLLSLVYRVVCVP
jgi:hypothetical protein